MKKILCILLIVALAAFCLYYLGNVISLAPLVQYEKALTPSPSPIYGNTMSVTLAPDAPTAVPVLKNGSTGESVLTAQRRLAELGYYTGGIDGQYGPGTASAVKQFQAQHGLDADGKIGIATSALLFSAEAQPIITAPPTPVPTATPLPTEAPTAVLLEETVSLDVPYVSGNGMPLLVNRTNPLPQGYTPYDLVCLNDVCEPEIVKIKYDNTYAEREAAMALMVMLRGAVAQGITNWQISAAYRDEAYQQQLFDNQVDTYMRDNGLSRASAISATRKTVADPGTSEHHIGTCFDITVPGKSFKGTKQADWLAANCWQYGFILRYAEDKESITGFLAEAWHFRWVGTEHSIPMRDENLCLEEYIMKYGR